MNLRPNILFILCDQFRFDCLSVLGHPTVSTQNLDTLAQNGEIFTHAFSSCPSCIAARASIFTGKSPSNTGFLGYQDCVDWNFDNMLPELLRNNGYQTHCVGKTHFFPQRKHCGFEGLDSYEAWQKFDNYYQNDYHEWLNQKYNLPADELQHGLDCNSWNCRPSSLPEELHNNSWVVTKGIEFIKKRDHTRPYFLNLSFHRPHPPIDPPQSFWDEYMNKELEEIPIGEWASVHDKPVNSLNCFEGKLDNYRLKKMRLAYYAQIAHIDCQIGRFLNTAKGLGEIPDLIIFTSDHGEMLGDHNLFRKTYAYQGSAGVPMIVWRKDGAKKGVNKTPVVLEDIYPTILDYANINQPNDIDGISMLSFQDENGQLKRNIVHGEHSSCYSADQAMQFLTDGRKKYIWFTNSNKEQLFDLEKDPYECYNLALDETYSAELLLWRKRMIDILAQRKQDNLSDGHELIPGLVPAYRKPY